MSLILCLSPAYPPLLCGLVGGDVCRAVAHAAATAVLAAVLFPLQHFSIARPSRGSRRRGNGGSLQPRP